MAQPHPRLSLAPLILLAALAVGGLRYQLDQPQLNDKQVAWYIGQGEVQVKGVLQAAPDVRENSVLLRLKASQVAVVYDDGITGPAIPVRGWVQVLVAPGEEWHYGDMVMARGKLTTPTETAEFSYREYLARQGVYAQMTYPALSLIKSRAGNAVMRWILALRERAVGLLEQLYPSPEAELLSGILLGVDERIPGSLQAAFNATGTAHIIAISGFNIAILAGLFFRLFSRLGGRWWGLAGTIVTLTLYALLAGASPSVVRAAIMGSLSLLGQQIGRRQAGLNTLAGTAMAMCLFNPNLLWDASFQLSFAATLGLILYAELLESGFRSLLARRLPPAWVNRLAGPVTEYVLFTLSAQVTSFVIVAYHFHRFSLVSLLANPLVLPPQPLVMVLGGVSVLAGLVFPAAGQVLAYLAYPFVSYTVRMTQWLSGWGGNFELGYFGAGWAAGYYAVLFGLTLSKDRLALVRKIVSPQAALVGLGALTFFAWNAVIVRPDGRLHLTLLESGGIPTLLIQSPGGEVILVNGGADSGELRQALGQRLPLLDRQLDWLIIASDAKDSLNSLDRTLSRTPARQALWVLLKPNETAKRLREQLETRQIPVNDAAPGLALELGDGARLEVLCQEQNSAVIGITWQSFKAAVLTGAAVKPACLAQVAPNVAAAPYELAGSLEINGLQLVLISDQAQDAQNPIDLNGIRVIRTSQSGWITLVTDGETLWVHHQR
jgi:competence protein ComEC